MREIVKIINPQNSLPVLDLTCAVHSSITCTISYNFVKICATTLSFYLTDRVKSVEIQNLGQKSLYTRIDIKEMQEDGNRMRMYSFPLQVITLVEMVLPSFSMFPHSTNLTKKTLGYMGKAT